MQHHFHVSRPRCEGGVVALLTGYRERGDRPIPSLMYVQWRKDSMLHTLACPADSSFRTTLVSIVLPFKTGGLISADTGPCCSVLSSCVNLAYRSKKITIDVLTSSSNIREAFAEPISLDGSKYVRNRHSRYRLWSDINIPERGGARATASMRRLGFATCMEKARLWKLILLGFFYAKNHPIAQSHINDIFELVSFRAIRRPRSGQLKRCRRKDFLPRPIKSSYKHRIGPSTTLDSNLPIPIRKKAKSRRLHRHSHDCETGQQEPRRSQILAKPSVSTNGWTTMLPRRPHYHQFCVTIAR
jgi:hypothetical protein